MIDFELIKKSISIKLNIEIKLLLSKQTMKTYSFEQITVFDFVAPDVVHTALPSNYATTFRIQQKN